MPPLIEPPKDKRGFTVVKLKATRFEITHIRYRDSKGRYAKFKPDTLLRVESGGYIKNKFVQNPWTSHSHYKQLKKRKKAVSLKNLSNSIKTILKKKSPGLESILEKNKIIISSGDEDSKTKNRCSLRKKRGRRKNEIRKHKKNIL